MRISDERMWILERFGDSDMQDLVGEIRRLRAALQEIQSQTVKALSDVRPEV